MPNLCKSSGSTWVKQFRIGGTLRFRHVGPKTDIGLANTLSDDVGQTNKSAAQNEQDVGRVDVNELLLRGACGRLEEEPMPRNLLRFSAMLAERPHRHVTRDGEVFSLAGNLIDFVDINDTDFGARGCRNQLP